MNNENKMMDAHQLTTEVATPVANDLASLTTGKKVGYTLFADSYLNEKLGNEFNDLIFDKDYLNIYSYMNIPESYKFKYNFKDNTGKVNLKKGIYITIDAIYIYIQELYLF